MLPKSILFAFLLLFLAGRIHSQNPGTVTDASGNTYPTVTIGKQVWMAENLRTTLYRNNTSILIVTENLRGRCHLILPGLIDITIKVPPTIFLTACITIAAV